ncbi:MAG: hypothetical protein M1371_00555 [Actinobacteria bacterium]|nr:hypothetical protein [Actinomycetota bacterium]
METIELDLGKVKLNLSDFSLHNVEEQAVEARQEIYQRIFAGASELYPLDKEEGISLAQNHSIGAKEMILDTAIDNVNQGDFKEEKISKIISSL